MRVHKSNKKCPGTDATMHKDNPCYGCGVCCMHLRTPPFALEDFAGLPQPLKREVDAHAGSETPCSKALDLMGMIDEAPCLWFDMRAGKCREWEYRPEVCREFEVGSEACTRMRADVGLAAPPVCVQRTGRHAPAPEHQPS